MDKVQQKLDSVQIPTGYTVALGVGATPVWIQSLTTWLELTAILFAILVGASTVYLNWIKIKKERRDRSGGNPNKS